MNIWDYESIQKPLAKELIDPNGEVTNVLVSGHNMSIKLPSKYFACECVCVGGRHDTYL